MSFSSEPPLTPIRIGTPAVLGRVQHLALPFELADVARIDAHLRHARLDGLEGIAVVKVDVGDHGAWCTRHHLGERVCILGPRHGHAHDVGSSFVEARDLFDAVLDVVRLARRHRLHRDGRATADLDGSYLDGAANSAGAFHKTRRVVAIK